MHSKKAASEQQTELEPTPHGEPNIVTDTKFESLYWNKELTEMSEEWEHVDTPLACCWMFGLLRFWLDKQKKARASGEALLAERFGESTWWLL